MEKQQIQREFIPALREGIEIVKMILFMKIREKSQAVHPGKDRGYHGMLAGATVNYLFGTPNPEERFQKFAQENQQHVEQMLRDLPSEMESLCIPLTDAIRMQFLCDHQEGMEDGSGEVLKRAKEFGILVEERNAPLPKQFMNLVYRVGKAYGLVRDQG